MKLAVALGFAALAGCVTTSEIVPTGKDSYMINGTAHGAIAIGGENVSALKAANAYCDKQQKHMIVRRSDASMGFSGATANIIFSCVTEDDPEYSRPNLRKDPTTIIEDQRQPR